MTGITFDAGGLQHSKPHLPGRQFSGTLKAMTVMLDMPKEIEAQFTAAARAQGVPLSDYVRILSSSTMRRRPPIFGRRRSGLPILNPALPPISCVGTLAWKLEYDPRVEKDLKAIGRAMQREILDYMDSRLPLTRIRAASVSR